MIDELESKTLLLDYYECVTGTPTKEPYYELILYTYDEDNLLLEEYSEGGKKYEYVKGYLVSKDEYEKGINLILDNKMHTWNDLKDNIAITGSTYVCKFRLKDEVIRVSSDSMPENGYEGFGSIKNYLISLKDDEKIIYENYTNDLSKEDIPPFIKDEDELLSYRNIIEPTIANYEEYFSLTNGMFNGNDSKLHCHISLIMKDNIFPNNDLDITISYSVDGEIKEDNEKHVTSENEWTYEDYSFERRTFVVDYTDKTVHYDNINIKNIKGSLISFNIPEEYIFEDRFGKYFLYENEYQIYYLNGLCGKRFEDDEGTMIFDDEIWYINFLD